MRRYRLWGMVRARLAVARENVRYAYELRLRALRFWTWYWLGGGRRARWGGTPRRAPRALALGALVAPVIAVAALTALLGSSADPRFLRAMPDLSMPPLLSLADEARNGRGVAGVAASGEARAATPARRRSDDAPAPEPRRTARPKPDGKRAGRRAGARERSRGDGRRRAAGRRPAAERGKRRDGGRERRGRERDGAPTGERAPRERNPEPAPAPTPAAPPPAREDDKPKGRGRGNDEREPPGKAKGRDDDRDEDKDERDDDD